MGKFVGMDYHKTSNERPEQIQQNVLTKIRTFTVYIMLFIME